MSISCNGVKHQSAHKTEFQAAMAYNVLALKLHDEFACLNDLTKDPSFIGPTLP